MDLCRALADDPAYSSQGVSASSATKAYGGGVLAISLPDGDRKGARDMTREWHGTFLDEDGIVADVLAKVRADPEAVKRWLDPGSWALPLLRDGRPDPYAPSHVGCLMFAGMMIRNYYGLWNAACPYTETDGGNLKIEDWVITDPRHPDNLSSRVIERVKAALREE